MSDLVNKQTRILGRLLLENPPAARLALVAWRPLIMSSLVVVSNAASHEGEIMLELAFLPVLIEISATIAYAVSGVLEASRKQMDIVGVSTVAFAAAFGGGTLRDLLIDRRPFFWVAHSEYVWMTLGLCGVAMLWMRSHHVNLTARAIQLPDTLGLGLFSIAGTAHAIHAGMPPLVATLMGVVTAVFGGVIRDVLCNEIPGVFTDHRPYAVCAFAGAWLYLGLDYLQLPNVVSMTLGVVAIVGLRLLAQARDWRLPTARASLDDSL